MSKTVELKLRESAEIESEVFIMFAPGSFAPEFISQSEKNGKKIWIFDTNKYYEYALRTRWIYVHPEKHYTTNPLRYVGKYTHTEEYGGTGDGRRSVNYFNDNGIVNAIQDNYDAPVCFREVIY